MTDTSVSTSSVIYCTHNTRSALEYPEFALGIHPTSIELLRSYDNGNTTERLERATFDVSPGTVVGNLISKDVGGYVDHPTVRSTDLITQ